MFLLPTILGVVLFVPKNDDQQNLSFVISCQPLEKSPTKDGRIWQNNLTTLTGQRMQMIDYQVLFATIGRRKGRGTKLIKMGGRFSFYGTEKGFPLVVIGQGPLA